ncbi:agamous-like MADS-box protein AGL80 isoform X1 [Arabidopsis lyrata subsp. lyrata]|uniref:agamous-like MADS-box protein AGL80 isoform X1 n=1 Tax=Arabidopsis lyrata subsp. lyrata TaxID=81972 RepID=UPI000A29DE54|nr:agamous-like MADS-box protein AGL80 isoform X1 [Arabidopsis lyrata subsp. lyrata]|eukprot:XP_020884864.1 agamous-like MADS-box protein AGL80 isoform X1 [Arabidopsis lyrata subsp. lyrata]
MARKKLNLTYISNDRMRKRSFNQRREGFMKKLNDLKILCDVNACAVIYNPFNSNPEMWPSKSEVDNVIKKLKMLTETQKKLKSVNHEEFLNLYISKVEKQSKKLIVDNKENCLKEVMFKCLSGNMGDFVMTNNDRLDLCKFIDQYLRNLYHHKNETLNNPNFEIGESSSMDMAPTTTIANMAPTTTIANMATTVVDEGMTPPIIPEVSSSSFLNSPLFNSPQLTNGLQFIVSPNHRLEDVNLASNLFFSDAQNICSPAMNQFITPSNQGAEHVNFLESNFLPNNNQEVYIPAMDQDDFSYPNQNHNENQQQRFIDEMMKYDEKTSFPWIVDNNYYNHNQ